MSETPACPRCESALVVHGRIGAEVTSFYPAGLRFWTFPKGLPLPIRGFRGGHGFGCASCGLVWSEVDPAKLRRMLANGGTEETRRWLRDREAERPD